VSTTPVRRLPLRGADLVLVVADPARALVRLRVDLDGAGCRDCVLPPGQLADVVGDAVRPCVDGEFELVLDDPRGPVRRAVA